MFLNRSSFSHGSARATISNWPSAAARLVALAAVAFSASSHAFIVGSIPSQGTVNKNAELVFMAWDNNTDAGPKVAFIKDLGISMADFFVNGQQDAGGQQFWYLGGTGTGTDGDAVWAQFLNTEVSTGVKVDPTKVQWAVFAYDGDEEAPEYEPDDFSLFTTLRQATSGSPTVISGLSDVQSSRLLGNVSASMTSLIGGANAQPGHSSPGNGSAIILQTVSPDFYFPFASTTTPTIGNGGTLTYNSFLNAPASNLIGQSSWFYKVSRGEDQFDQDLPVTIDEFDNLGADGYWGLAAASDPARTGQYFLSYTIAAFESAEERAAGLLYGNNFARLGGVLSLSSASGRGTTVLGLANSFVRGIAQARAQASAADDGRAFITESDGVALGIDGDRALATFTTAVPEPQTWLLFSAGLGLLAWRAGRCAGR